LGQPAGLLDRLHAELRAAQATAPVDPHLHAVDQHVGHCRVGEQRGERAGADQVGVDPVGQP
jgi:hypothetical protein